MSTILASDRVAEERRKHLGHMSGGVLCFDGLNKTADHAAIVRDARLQELWSRLAPYVHEVASGRSGGAAYNIRTIEGHPLTIPEVRELLGDTKSVLFLGETDRGKPDYVRRAKRISQLLNAPVLWVPRKQRERVRFLGGPDTKILHPNLSTDEDVFFYEQPPIEPPPRRARSTPYHPL